MKLLIAVVAGALMGVSAAAGNSEVAPVHTFAKGLESQTFSAASGSMEATVTSGAYMPANGLGRYDYVAPRPPL